MTADQIPISVVVPVHNGAAELRECLAALVAAAPPRCEILVVDDASGEDIADVARAYGIRLLRLGVRQGPAAARNHGARAARGDVVLFVDADVVIRPSTVRHVLELLDRCPEITAVFGSYDAQPRAPGIVSQYRNLLHHFVHQAGDPEAATFWAGCGAIRRSALRQVRGFDDRRFPRPSIEDIELGYRLRRCGHRILLDRTLQVTHLKRWTLASMLRSDFGRRGLPWARLILQQATALDHLNLKLAQRVSVALVAVAAVALVAAVCRPELLALVPPALAGVLVINGEFWRFLARERGLTFAVAAVPLHLLHYGVGGLGFAVAWLEAGTRRCRSPLPATSQPVNNEP